MRARGLWSSSRHAEPEFAAGPQRTLVAAWFWKSPRPQPVALVDAGCLAHSVRASMDERNPDHTGLRRFAVALAPPGKFGERDPTAIMEDQCHRWPNLFRVTKVEHQSSRRAQLDIYLMIPGD